MRIISLRGGKGAWRLASFAAVMGFFAISANPVMAAENQKALLREALAQLLKQDFAAAQATMRLADPSGNSEETKNLQTSVNAVAGMPGIILDSFRKDAGKEVEVAFLKARKPLRIVKVGDDGEIYAEELIRIDGRVAATSPLQFPPAQLSVAERVNRLGKDTSPERQIMRGLLAWEVGKPELARSFFKESKCLLGERLVTHLFEMDADAAFSELATQKSVSEAAAANAYDAILKTTGLAPLRGDSGRLISSIETARFNEAQVEDVRKNVKLLQGRLAATDVAKSNESVLARFALIRPNFPITTDKAALDKALEELAKDNPKEIIRATFNRSIPGKLALNLDNYPSLTDISAISSIPITALVLGNCNSLSSLKSLTGMPLESLEIWGNAIIADFSPLKGMPLENLRFNGNGPNRGKLKDLTFLAGMPLKKLDVSFNEVKDLRALKDLPLSALVVRDNLLSDLRDLRGMRLEKLDIVGNREVRDLAPLKGMPLEYLDIGYTSVSDLSPLRGMRLKVLHCYRVASVSSLEPLTGMPLRILGISGTAVSDLSPLKGMPLEVLDIRGAPVTDLTPIKDIHIPVRGFLR